MPKSYNVNRVCQYNEIDAQLDNPHLAPRDITNVVREANGLPPKPMNRPLHWNQTGIYGHKPIRFQRRIR